MKQVNLLNTDKVMQTVMANDGQTYFLPPKKLSKLPMGVDVEVNDLPQSIKRTTSEN